VQIGFDGSPVVIELDLVPDAGHLSGRVGGQEVLRLAFYRGDYALVLDTDGTATSSRINFVRDAGGSVVWLRYGGRLFRRGPATTLRGATTEPLPLPATLPYHRPALRA